MKRSFFSPVPLALLALAGPAASQSVTFRGKVEDVPGTANQFVVDCTNTQLTSASIDLNAFVGQEVLIDGTWNGSTASPAVAVTAISMVPETFEIGGGASIGSQARFKTFGTPGDAAAVFASLGSSFLPFGPAGVGFLDPATLLNVGVGSVDGLGVFQVIVPVPNDPALVGLFVLGQGAMLGPATPLLLTNPDCKTVQT